MTTATPVDSNAKDDIDPVDIAPNWFWVKGSNGKASVSTTLLLIAFLTTTAAYVLSIFQSIGPLSIRPFDVAACSVYLAPLVALYFSRRFTEAHYGSVAAQAAQK